MSEPILPKPEAETFGGWVNSVGVYVNRQEGVVIAQCKEVAGGFALALAIDDKGSISLQHLADDGKLHWATVSSDTYEKAILDMLQTLKGRVKLVPKVSEEVVS